MLRAAVAVMHKAGEAVVAPGVDRLLDGIEDEMGGGRRGYAPANDPMREDVDDKGGIDEARHVAT